MYLGIDPGKEGGIAAVDAQGALVWTRPTPLVEGAGRGDYNLPAIVALLLEARAAGVELVTVELLQALPPIARPGMVGGSAANFARGLSHGWAWVLTALGLPYLRPLPQTWQKRMLQAGPANTTKDRSRAAALERWPAHDFRRTPRSTKVWDGLTDAALLAEFGRLSRAAEGLPEHEAARVFRAPRRRAPTLFS